MKLANDALLAIIGVFRKGLMEGSDVSDLLRAIDLVANEQGQLSLSADHNDIWAMGSH